MPRQKRQSSSTNAARQRPGGGPSQTEYEQAAELRRALREFAGSSEHVTRSHGLTTERYQMLLLIKVAEQRSEKITVSDLANALNVVNSSATQLVRRAENLRLLKREVSERDARIRYLRLTDEGERRLRAAVAELSENRSRLLNFLKPLRQ